MGRPKKTLLERRADKYRKAAINKMTELGTYRIQFDAAISDYANMRAQLDMLMEQFAATGYKVTEEYTNKSGATNERKTALYSALEMLRRDIASADDRLGLSPSGMKRINEAEMKNRKKKSKIAAALEGF